MSLALITGSGALPAALVATLPERPLICALDGFAPDGLVVDVTFRLERLVPLFRLLADKGISQVAFAGAVQRPRLDPALFDPATAQLLPRLLTALQSGDDATLRAVIALFEEHDLTVQGIAEIAPNLLPGPGLLAGKITAQDEADATRAAVIVAALGAVDVGQGAVVAQGMCLALEALPGTDAMLASISPGPRRQGLLYKAAKPVQDLRVDLPTIGPTTLRGAHAAGLAGVAFAAGQVICLDLPAMQTLATDLGLFLWARKC
jgi:DUF1009 family protein